MAALFAALVGILIVFGFLAVSVALRGYVLTIMWGWFIAPVFHLPELTIPIAIGIAMVVVYLTGARNQSGEKTTWADVFLSPLLALFFGWIVHMFV